MQPLFSQSLPFVIFSFRKRRVRVSWCSRTRSGESATRQVSAGYCASSQCVVRQHSCAEDLISIIFTLFENTLSGCHGCRTVLVSIFAAAAHAPTDGRRGCKRQVAGWKWLLTFDAALCAGPRNLCDRAPSHECGGFFDDVLRPLCWRRRLRWQSASSTVVFFPPGNERIWMLAIFAAFVLAGLNTMFSDNPLLEIVPDYLLVLFFSVHLYYSERLVFFDVFFEGPVRLWLRACCFWQAPFALRPIFAPSSGWNGIWITALAVAPLYWSCAPFLYKKLGNWIDGRLGRRYSP